MNHPHLKFNAFLGKTVHLGVCGSVASFKALELVRGLAETGARVGATLTDSASKFVTPLSFSALGADPVHGAMFAPGQDPFSHLEPGHLADCLAIVPATANFLAKMAHGLADDMLSCQTLAFPGPIVVAPAMNPMLWNAQATRENWDKVKSRGAICLEPERGGMACGDAGKGRLPRSERIFSEIMRALSPKDLSGKRILLTLGPTREYFDAARFWSNPSTGLMGACLAMSAWLRGADVTVVKGPVSPWLPDSIKVVEVVSAQQMRDACHELWPQSDIGCMVAAVADFSPAPHGLDKKYKKQTSGEFNVAFTRTPDILLELGQNKDKDQRLIGFCAETDNLLENAQGKRERKRCDLMVANRIGAASSGFASTTNDVVVLDAAGRVETWPNLPKTEVAWRIWDWMVL